MPKTTRKYHTKHKTTTRQGKNEYQKLLMRDIRRQRSQAFKQFKIKYPKIYTDLFGKPKNKRKR